MQGLRGRSKFFVTGSLGRQNAQNLIQDPYVSAPSSKAQVPRTVNVHGRDERESLRERQTERQRERKREREREREKFIENLEVTEGR